MTKSRKSGTQKGNRQNLTSKRQRGTIERVKKSSAKLTTRLNFSGQGIVVGNYANGQLV